MRVLCLGEICWDEAYFLNRFPAETQDAELLEYSEGPGGSALNTAMALSNLDIDITLAGNSVGKDGFGKALNDIVSSQGIHRHFGSDLDETPSTKVLVNRETGSRSFILNHKNIQNFSETQLSSLVQKERKTPFQFVFIQPYIKLLSKKFLETIAFEYPGLIFSQDLEPHHEALEKCDFLQLSTNLSLAEGTEDILQRYSFKGRFKNILLTAGSEGAALLTSKGVTARPSKSVSNVVNTTGCGDTFRAGFIYGLSQKRSLNEALEWGQKAGAYKAQQKNSFCILPKEIFS